MLGKIGKYEIRQEIGRGAMGAVYEGFDTAIGRRVAIKILRTDVFNAAQLPEVLVRFRREAQAAGGLSHSHVVTIHDYGEEAGTPYIVMEYIAGQELGKHLDRGTRFPLGDIVRIMTQLLGALSAAHERGVVHRDLKPANMFLLPDRSLKVVDFGIARLDSSDLTETGTMLGTPAYMSPEQCLGTQVDHRSDVYSAGVILYQLLTGDKPFTGSVTSIIQKVLRQEPLPPSELNPMISPAWDAVVARAMAKKPEARYASARQFADAIQAATRDRMGEPRTQTAKSARDPEATVPLAATASPPEKKPSPPRRTGVAPGVAVAAVLAVAAGTYVVLNREPAPEPAKPVATAPAAPVVDEEKLLRTMEERMRREFEGREAAQKEAGRVAAERTAAEKLAAERAAAAKVAADRAAAEKLAAERGAAAALAAERAAAARLAAERSAAEKLAAQKAAAEKLAAQKAAADKLAAEEAAAARLAAEKAATEKAAAEKAEEERIARVAANETGLPAALDGTWTGTTSGSFQCPNGSYTVTVKNGNVAGWVNWGVEKSEVSGHVQSDDAVVLTVMSPDSRAEWSRFTASLRNGRLVGEDRVSCSLGTYRVTLSRD